MSSEPIKVLLVEDNPGDVRLIREMLKEAKTTLAALEDTPSLMTAVERLAKGGIDAVLLDLGLPDSQGISAFCGVTQSSPPHSHRSANWPSCVTSPNASKVKRLSAGFLHACCSCRMRSGGALPGNSTTP